MTMGRHAPDIEAWISGWDAAEQAAVRWFADKVHEADPRISEAIKWRRLTFTVQGNWHHWLCAVGVTRRGVSLMLHKGALLHDPEALLVGEGRYLRQLPFEVAAGNPDAVVALVREAVAHQTDMLDEQEAGS
jgi:hypothetical protein